MRAFLEELDSSRAHAGKKVRRSLIHISDRRYCTCSDDPTGMKRSANRPKAEGDFSGREV